MQLVYVCDPEMSRHLPSAPGVYWLLAMSLPFGRGEPTPAPIGRLAGEDPYGILYIGHTGDLKRRVGPELADPLNRFHRMTRWGDLDKFKRGGVGYNYFHSRTVSILFPPNKLAIAYERTEDGNDPKKLEQMLYYNYRQAFGETPPFNRDFAMSEWHSKDIAVQNDLCGPLSMPEDRYWPKLR